MTNPRASTQPLYQRLTVLPRHSQLVHWPAGTVITPVSGGAWLTETPRWVGERLLRQRVRIEAHATHVMGEAGWVAVWAEQETVLKVIPGQPAPQGLAPVLQSAWGHVLAAVRRVRLVIARRPARVA